MRHTLTVLVENQPGVLTRVAGLFSRRGYNIESLAVGETHEKSISRMTIVVDGDDRVIEQVVKQLNKLVDVISVRDITEEEHVDRELVLIKVKAEPAVRGEIMQIVEIFRARIVDIGQNTLIIECTGDEGKIRAIEKSLKPFGILELVRTGKIAMVRGPKYEDDKKER
ncbi:acetolactate synthase small subunit IlvH [Thermacetogenium phaeum DSM 12270]|jgi:acetolactate synthase-1/3 small subunit|uniref:Acetolactate synthase small subunit n=2 Tax=Thermacetogenium phaeum TaxID=85874 RepID=K4LJP6_THEPS|nr:acetolactate synthase small subunit [Thermacetogenium phaeum]MDK2881150.1 acetolactate synthase small subunit [Clostridia bacterium]MDN5366438.1 acetolactate synthase small subunit [Thermacetogenium sp.]AFV12180.1 acetolactate synthase small subunit IlvH [Thermacetogenium phaeum DSM 12270]KUK36278.1 MAG: Acetolactate synthase small subunit IlvH [Thermacetogenium phaeum]MDN5375526.1 acetolactate synthase small subunit [Thermacetogenium sp.]